MSRKEHKNNAPGRIDADTIENVQTHVYEHSQYSKIN